MSFSNVKPNYRYSRLFMRYWAVFLLISCFAVPLARADIALDEVADVSKDETVSVYFPEGKLSVVGWEKNKVKVEGRLDKHVDSHSFVSENGRTSFTVKMKEPKKKAWK